MFELATQDDGTFIYQYGDRGRALADTKAMGCSHVRLNVYSSRVAQYGWGPLDTAVNALIAAGIAVQLTITGTPRWDYGKPDGGVPTKDPSPVAFAKFAGAVAAHFRDRVHRFSLWNEPNHPSFLQVSSGSKAEHYGKLYRAGYVAVREHAPGAQILFGELSGMIGSQAFLRAAVAGHRTFASGVAVHPYQYQTNPTKPAAGDNLQWGNLPKLAGLLTHLRGNGLLMTRDHHTVPVFVTEFGYFCEGEKRGISESHRAAYVERTLKDAKEWGLRQYLYYTLNESPGAAWNTGVVAQNGARSSTFFMLRDCTAALRK